MLDSCRRLQLQCMWVGGSRAVCCLPCRQAKQKCHIQPPAPTHDAAVVEPPSGLQQILTRIAVAIEQNTRGQMAIARAVNAIREAVEDRWQMEDAGSDGGSEVGEEEVVELEEEAAGAEKEKAKGKAREIDEVGEGDDAGAAGNTPV
jgi:hypothetical protein